LDRLYHKQLGFCQKDGIIYDAKQLLADVKAMVDAEKAKTNWKLKQPGVKN